jgi:hypothetical protein
VADLARRRAVALDQLPVEHQSGPDTQPDLHHQQVRARRVAELQLGEDGRVGIVDDVDRHVETAADLRRERGVVEAQVGRLLYDALREHDAGRADADPEDRPLCPRHQVADEPGDQADGGGPGAAPARHRPALDDVADEVHHTADEAALVRQVQAERVARVRDDLQQRPRLARSHRAATALLDDALVDQAGHQSADGRRGQLRDPGQIRPGLRPVAPELVEDQRAVVPSAVPREHLAPVPERPARPARVCDKRHSLFIKYPN